MKFGASILNKTIMKETKIQSNSSQIIHEFLKFLIVGGISFLIDYSISLYFNQILFTHYLISVTFGFIGGIIVNYTLSNQYVFSNHKVTDKKKEFTIFTIIGILGLMLTQVLIYLLTGMMHIPFMFSRPIVTGIIMCFNFGNRKLFLF